MFCIRKGLCSEDPNPIPDHDCKRNAYCGSMFMWLFEQLAVIPKTWTFLKMMVVQLLGGHDPDLLCSNLIKWLEQAVSWIFQAFGFFQRHIPSVTMKCCPSICSWVKQYFSIYQQEKELGINNSVSTKMLLVKIVFRNFWDVYCANPDQCTAALCPCIQSDIPTWCQWPHAFISDELTCSPTHQD